MHPSTTSARSHASSRPLARVHACALAQDRCDRCVLLNLGQEADGYGEHSRTFARCRERIDPEPARTPLALAGEGDAHGRRPRKDQHRSQ
jgi:hypothetical protein